MHLPLLLATSLSHFTNLDPAFVWIVMGPRVLVCRAVNWLSIKAVRLRYRPAMVGPCHRRCFPECRAVPASRSAASRLMCQGAKCCCRRDRSSNFWPCCRTLWQDHIGSSHIKSYHLLRRKAKSGLTVQKSSKNVECLRKKLAAKCTSRRVP